MNMHSKAGNQRQAQGPGPEGQGLSRESASEDSESLNAHAPVRVSDRSFAPPPLPSSFPWDHASHSEGSGDPATSGADTPLQNVYSDAPFAARRLSAPVQARLKLPGAELWQPKTSAQAHALHSLAEKGVSGSGQPLPYREVLKKHLPDADFLDDARMHVDASARQATGALQAHAYATSKDGTPRIAFDSPQPDLHTVAHEVAHLVQQRRGIELSHGLGRAGDAHEREADRLADAVMRGDANNGQTSVNTSVPGELAHGPSSEGIRASQASGNTGVQALLSVSGRILSGTCSDGQLEQALQELLLISGDPRRVSDLPASIKARGIARLRAAARGAGTSTLQHIQAEMLEALAPRTDESEADRLSHTLAEMRGGIRISAPVISPTVLPSRALTHDEMTGAMGLASRSGRELDEKKEEEKKAEEPEEEKVPERRHSDIHRNQFMLQSEVAEHMGRLFGVAYLEKTHFRKLVRAWAKADDTTPGGEAVFRPEEELTAPKGVRAYSGMKKLDRSLQKVKEKMEPTKDGKPGSAPLEAVSAQTDLLAATIQFKELGHILTHMPVLRRRIAESGATIVRLKNRLKMPGLRDFLINIRLPSGFVVELQLHLEAALEIKQSRAVPLSDKEARIMGMRKAMTHDVYDYSRLLSEMRGTFPDLEAFAAAYDKGESEDLLRRRMRERTIDDPYGEVAASMKAGTHLSATASASADSAPMLRRQRTILRGERAERTLTLRQLVRQYSELMSEIDTVLFAPQPDDPELDDGLQARMVKSAFKSYLDREEPESTLVAGHTPDPSKPPRLGKERVYSGLKAIGKVEERSTHDIDHAVRFWERKRLSPERIGHVHHAGLLDAGFTGLSGYYRDEAARIVPRMGALGVRTPTSLLDSLRFYHGELEKLVHKKHAHTPAYLRAGGAIKSLSEVMRKIIALLSSHR